MLINDTVSVLTKLQWHKQNTWQNSWHRNLGAKKKKENQNTVTLSQTVGVKRLHFRLFYDTQLLLEAI
jgi:hypothetical protein